MGPPAMSVQALPAETKELIKIEYENFYKFIETEYSKNLSDMCRRKYTGIINFMMAEDRSDLLLELRNTTEKLDKVRGQSLEQTIPWLFEILKNIK